MTERNGSPVKVNTPEFKDSPTTYVRIATVGEMRDIEELGDDIGNVDRLIAFFMACVCQSDGTQLYPPDRKAEVLNLPWTAVERCAAEAIRINGLAPDESGEPGGN